MRLYFWRLGDGSINAYFDRNLEQWAGQAVKTDGRYKVYTEDWSPYRTRNVAATAATESDAKDALRRLVSN